MRKFIIISLTLLFCLFFITPYNREKPTFASAATTTYTDTTATENFAIGSPNAIESIKSADFVGTPFLRLFLPYQQFKENNLVFEFLSTSSITNNAPYVMLHWSVDLNNGVVQNFPTFNTSAFFSNSSGLYLTPNGTIIIGGVKYYKLKLVIPMGSACYFGDFDGWGYNTGDTIPNTYFSKGGGWTNRQLLSYASEDSVLDELIDFNSSTNFSFSNAFMNTYNDNSFMYKLYNYIYDEDFDFVYQDSYFTGGIPSVEVFRDYFIKNSNFVNFDNFKISFYSSLTASGPVSSYSSVKGVRDIYFQRTVNPELYMPYVKCDKVYNCSLDFQIYQPTYRTKNSLLIYNFDYTAFLSSVNKVTYRLMKGEDYFDVVYNGTIPNFTEIVINSPSVNNILFDEYIYLKFNFVDNVLNIETLKDLSVGFDFNFTYWVEPFVIKESVFSNFNYRPSYMNSSIVFTVVPPNLYIPVNAWVHNALIYTCFYMPVVSSILSPFSPLLGGVLQSFQLFSSLFPTNSVIMELFNFMLVYVIFTSVFNIGNKAVLVVSNRISERKNQRIADDKADRVSAKKVEKHIRKKNKK